MALLAITRGISPAIAQCELTHRERTPIDLERARRDHAAYEDALTDLGCEVHRLPADADAPDCVFIEDVAVVFDELAILTRPGAVSRRRESSPVAAALAKRRRLITVDAPATLDGGDVLVAERRVFVGLTTRTDEAGAAALERALAPLGYEVTTVPVRGALHLKSVVSHVGPGLLLIDPAGVDPAAFDGFELLTVAEGESPAANALRIGDTVLVAAGFDGTRRRLEARGLKIVEVENGELAKAEGGLTCCSLILEVPESGA